MSDQMRVRAYNVHFGDAILITFPESVGESLSEIRNVLIDFGNVLSGGGGDDAVFAPVMQDILQQLGGRPLDLYVMTHEHLDHVQGLEYCATKHQQELDVRFAWLTASADPEYYANGKHPDSKQKFDAAQAAFAEVERFVSATPTAAPIFEYLLLNNNPRSTADCVERLRSLTDHPAYVHREFDLSVATPFTEAVVKVLAPEEDTSAYYGRIQRFGLQPPPVTPESDAGGAPIPPPGVDAGAFYDLVAGRRRGYADNLLTIDRAANNTSVVLSIEWRGLRLLFPGDAEQASWTMMSKLSLLQPVDLLKVGHHGSINGSPQVSEIFDQILPAVWPSERYAVMSTCTNTYPSVPDAATIDLITSRCTLLDTREVADGTAVEITLLPRGGDSDV
jgi:hypothetical protein